MPTPAGYSSSETGDVISSIAFAARIEQLLRQALHNISLGCSATPLNDTEATETSRVK